MPVSSVTVSKITIVNLVVLFSLFESQLTTTIRESLVIVMLKQNPYVCVLVKTTSMDSRNKPADVRIKIAFNSELVGRHKNQLLRAIMLACPLDKVIRRHHVRVR